MTKRTDFLFAKAIEIMLGAGLGIIISNCGEELVSQNISKRTIGNFAHNASKFGQSSKAIDAQTIRVAQDIREYYANNKILIRIASLIENLEKRPFQTYYDLQTWLKEISTPEEFEEHMAYLTEVAIVRNGLDQMPTTVLPPRGLAKIVYENFPMIEIMARKRAEKIANTK